MKKGEVKMFKRHRKLRKNEVIRNLVKDVYISKDDLIYPILKVKFHRCLEFLDIQLIDFRKNWMNL